MRRWSAFLLSVVYLLAILYLLAIAAAVVGLLTQGITPQMLLDFTFHRCGTITLYVLAAGTLLGLVACLLALIRLYGRLHLIERRGAQGRIQIAPLAIRDFVQQVLEGTWGLTSSRVTLRQTAQGHLRLRVEATLPASDNLLELSEQIQTKLKDRIEDQVGIAVEEVEIYTPHIGAPRRETEPPASQMPDESYIGLGATAPPLRVPPGEEANQYYAQ